MRPLSETLALCHSLKTEFSRINAFEPRIARMDADNQSQHEIAKTKSIPTGR
jgi:hypothetical protein